MKNSGFFATSSSRVKQSLNKNGLSSRSWERYLTVSVTRLGDLLGNFLKRVATINLSKLPTFLGNFCKGVKIFHFSREIIFGQLL